MEYGPCIPPEPMEDEVGKFIVSTIQTCDGRWETCVFHGDEQLMEETEMTWDGHEEQHRTVVARIREK